MILHLNSSEMHQGFTYTATTFIPLAHNPAEDAGAPAAAPGCLTSPEQGRMGSART